MRSSALLWPLPTHRVTKLSHSSRLLINRQLPPPRLLASHRLASRLHPPRRSTERLAMLLIPGCAACRNSSTSMVLVVWSFLTMPLVFASRLCISKEQHWSGGSSSRRRPASRLSPSSRLHFVCVSVLCRLLMSPVSVCSSSSREVVSLAT